MYPGKSPFPAIKGSSMDLRQPIGECIRDEVTIQCTISAWSFSGGQVVRMPYNSEGRSFKRIWCVGKVEEREGSFVSTSLFVVRNYPCS